MPVLTVRAGRPEEPAAQALLQELDRYLLDLYPVESNHIDDLEELSRPNVVFAIAERDGIAVGCGAVKLLHDSPPGPKYGEIKRLYVSPVARGTGAAHCLMDWLEGAAAERGARCARLETGGDQPEALALYEVRGYRYRDVFGCYVKADISLSLFMEKAIG